MLFGSKSKLAIEVGDAKISENKILGGFVIWLQSVPFGGLDGTIWHSVSKQDIGILVSKFETFHHPLLSYLDSRTLLRLIHAIGGMEVDQISECEAQFYSRIQSFSISLLFDETFKDHLVVVTTKDRTMRIAWAPLSPNQEMMGPVREVEVTKSELHFVAKGYSDWYDKLEQSIVT